MTSKKEQKKKLAPGMAATVNRLETSHAVLSALREISGEGPYAHLSHPAHEALGLLEVIQESEEDVDKDMVDLVLGTCGLIYIMLDAFETNTAPTTNYNYVRLTEAIVDFRDFCKKKIHGSFYRNLKKRTEDQKVIDGFRDYIHAWMIYFGGEEATSVHGCLEDVISRKLRVKVQENKVEKPSHAPPDDNHTTNSYIAKPAPPLPLPMPSMFPVPEVQIHFPSPSTPFPSTPLPNIVPGQDVSGSALAQPTPIKFPHSPKPKSSFDAAECEARTKRRLLEELRKQEERERWKRSEELYNSLPPASPEDGTHPLRDGTSLDTITAHMKSSTIQLPSATPPPTPFIPKVTHTNISATNLSRPSQSPRPAVPQAPQGEAELAAARAKQVNDDRLAAILLAGEMQLEMEAAEKARKKAEKASKRPAAIPTGRTGPSGYASDDIPVRVESPSTAGQSAGVPYPRSHSRAGSGVRPASPQFPRPRRNPSPLRRDASMMDSNHHDSSPQSSSFNSNELRAPRPGNSRDYSREGPRHSSDSVRPLPSPLQQTFRPEEINAEVGGYNNTNGAFYSHVSRSGVSLGNGSMNVRNIGS